MSTPFYKDDHWECPDMPEGHVCCPSGSRPQARQTFTKKSYNIFAEGCPDDPDITSCGPKPQGAYICCQAAHKWIPASMGEKNCPVAEANRGISSDVAALVAAMSPIKTQQNLQTKLILIGIPFVIIGLILFILVARK